jgi:hypothetical protein
LAAGGALGGAGIVDEMLQPVDLGGILQEHANTRDGFLEALSIGHEARLRKRRQRLGARSLSPTAGNLACFCFVNDHPEGKSPVMLGWIARLAHPTRFELTCGRSV